MLVTSEIISLHNHTHSWRGGDGFVLVLVPPELYALAPHKIQCCVLCCSRLRTLVRGLSQDAERSREEVRKELAKEFEAHCLSVR